jgi:hypothetical protein
MRRKDNEREIFLFNLQIRGNLKINIIRKFTDYF